MTKREATCCTLSEDYIVHREHYIINHLTSIMKEIRGLFFWVTEFRDFTLYDYVIIFHSCHIYIYSILIRTCTSKVIVSVDEEVTLGIMKLF